MRIIIGFIVFIGLAISIWPAEAPEQINSYYDDIASEGSSWLDTNGQAWDLTRCDLILTYTMDMSTYYPEWKHTEWTMVGIGSGAWAWMTSGAPSASITNPDRHDIDDKLHLGSMPNKFDETSYDVLYPNDIMSDPIGDPWSNYGIWFDRDGVAKGQREFWGMDSGSNYNTGGVYEIELVYHAISDSLGTVFSTINGIQAGFYEDWKNAEPDYFPVGMSFSGDLDRVKVFASVWGENVTVTDIQAKGCQSIP